MKRLNRFRHRFVLGVLTAALGVFSAGCDSDEEEKDTVNEEVQGDLVDQDVEEQGDQDIEEECEPRLLYGPQPCRTDEECVEWNWEGWYCDLDNAYPDGCGDEVGWPTCKRSP